ncbi:MAG: DUF3303 domain-containing protein [Candidatus Bathyarchaeia archaeon]
MLFHVIATHTAENCPGYDLKKMGPQTLAAAEKMNETAKQLKVKVHFILSAAPEHTMYALLEADSLVAVSDFLIAMPFRQDFKVTPVVHIKDTLKSLKARMAKK